MIAGELVVDRPKVDRLVQRGTAPSSARASWRQAKTGGASPALKAVELIDAARDGDRDAGFAWEDDALEAMSTRPSCRPLYAFDLVQKRAKTPGRAPTGRWPARSPRVGHRGRRPDGLAARAALRAPPRVPVVLTDLDQERVDKGVGYVAEIDKLPRQGRIGPGQGQPAQGAGDRGRRQGEVFADADFVIEAVFEEMSVKKSVFADVEKAVSPSACWPPTPVAVDHRDGRRPRAPERVVASTSSTRSR